MTLSVEVVNPACCTSPQTFRPPISRQLYILFVVMIFPNVDCKIVPSLFLSVTYTGPLPVPSSPPALSIWSVRTLGTQLSHVTRSLDRQTRRYKKRLNKKNEHSLYVCPYVPTQGTNSQFHLTISMSANK